MDKPFLAKLRRIDPYVPGEQPQGREYIKLNTNESPYPPAPGVIQVVAAASEALRLYPDPEASGLRLTVEKLEGLPFQPRLAVRGEDAAGRWLELPEESPPESPVPGSSPEPPGSPLGSSTPLGSSGSMIWPPSPWTVHCSVPAAAT